MRKALVIHSPHAGKAAELSQALTFIQQSGVSVIDTVSIAALDALPNQGAHWIERGIDLIVAAGGDGLVGGVITHIAESGPPLGILPLGTANDIARSLQLPQDLQGAVEVIAHGKQTEIDIGLARPAEQAPHQSNTLSGMAEQKRLQPQRHGFFAHALTVGLNVEFARLATNVAIRQRFGSLTYPVAALEVLRNYTPLEMTISFEDLLWVPPGNADQQALVNNDFPPLRCRALQATVINAPIFGGIWQLSVPGASLQDRLLDIVIIEDIDWETLSMAITRFFSWQEQQQEDVSSWNEKYAILHSAELTGIPGIHHLRGRGVTITTAADPQDVTLDGEVRGQTPVHACMADKRLRVMVPQ